ncbi:CheR family methyltransferase [Variovorax paradoxus]|uniref:histidine kinase n=1 Tax=Variovorax paradoxus (strain EPS) TaxID=595537 RepID=E6V7H6_VARPE|nr:CheR family methyltransferase [Variovorax paradoxus]ADU34898.1 signal transduction histidine kinase with CheB and CheR activity [Variovorax paradoxus EPS]
MSDADAALIPSSLNFPVIGIGASAGGLEALLRFFEHLPARAGMAFVVILHLSPKHESSAADILQRTTRMKVSQVTRPTPIEVDQVYVIPPGVELTMNDGYLRVAPSERAKGQHVTVDVFFRTLAEAHRERAVSVVMSGTGSDGAVGLTRIKERGGIAIAQAPADAAHTGMPLAAIATGMVDIVLPAADIGQRLIDLWTNARQIRMPDAEKIGGFVAPPETQAAAQQAEQALQEIIGLLRTHTRHDFRHYKRATVLRRIERRLQVNRLTDLPAYRDFLREHPQEAVPLLQDMLISVTNFFRDRDSFEALERDVLPELVQRKQAGDPLRAWVAGCATGEEAYSLSILLREQADLHARPLEIQIFATDIDDRAIATARKAVYAQGIVEDMSPSRLRQFFMKDHDQYRVSTTVREPVLFASHNLLRDPPFSRLDLICCRNLLIYLDRAAQAHVLEMFRIALKPGGYLFLGTSESIDAVGSLFTPVDKKNRIFRVNPDLPPGRHMPLISDMPPAPQAGTFVPPRRTSKRTGSERASFAELHQAALEQFSPPSVLINAEHEVLHLSNGVGRFLERASGEPSNNLLNNVRPDIRLELRTALFKANQTARSVETRLVQRQENGHQVFLNIIVRPLQPAEGESQQLTLVVFDEVEESMRANDGEPVDAARELLIGQLEEEIRQLKLHLQDTVESGETSTEELKASNEELQAINEELRSASEELETSKEELQSMNEELVTVNFELKVKVEERGHINDDLQNLIASSEIATVFVDRGMHVKRYTPHAGNLFNLIPSDLGRSLFDITSRLEYPELEEDTAAAFNELRTIERHVPSTDGRHFLARILPYRTAEDKIEGAILNFFDISELRFAQDKVRAGEERLRLVAATTRDFAIITTDEAGLITTWNAGAQRIFGYTEEEMLRRPIAVIFTAEDQAHGVPQQEMRRATETGRAADERWHERKDGSRFFCSGVTSSLDPASGGGFAKIARDMTGTKQQELAQEHRLFKEKQANLSAQMANELKDKFLAVMSHELKQPLNLIQMNAELLMHLPAAAQIPAVQRVGETIKRAVASQTRIINDLLDLSRIRTGKLRLSRVTVDLGELVQSVAQAAVADAPKKKLLLETHCDEAVHCHGDRVRVEQIAWNLLSNAVKFTPDGGRISVRVETEGDFARLTVADTGCGIAAEFLPHVFGMFNQADGDTALPNGGLGIGLALVQELALAHGGRAEVKSAGPGEGAEFTVWLPGSGATDRPAKNVPHAEVSFGGWRILAVDDYVDALAPFAEVLRLEGAVVDVADSARKGLELLDANTYDLLVSDLGMPEMDGYQFIAEVRKRPATRALHAIAMSGFGRRADARRALEAGFNAHLPKPASIEELKAAIARL